MKQKLNFLLACLLIGPFSFAQADDGIPNLAGKWHSTELNELAGRQLNKMQGNLQNSIITGSCSGSIEQVGRFFIFKNTFKLSSPVATVKRAKTQVAQGEDVKYCLIAYDNISLYCISDEEAYNVVGKIENANTISYVETEAGHHNKDPYVLYATLVKDSV